MSQTQYEKYSTNLFISTIHIYSKAHPNHFLKSSTKTIPTHPPLKDTSWMCGFNYAVYSITTSPRSSQPAAPNRGDNFGKRSFANAPRPDSARSRPAKVGVRLRAAGAHVCARARARGRRGSIAAN